MKKLIAEIIFDTESILVSDNLLHASFGALDRGNITELAEYGIYVNKGTLSFIDRDSSFKNLYKDNVGKVRFWLGYEVTCVATFDIESAEINEETKQAELNLISHLMEWQNTKIYRSLFRQYNGLFESKTALQLVEFVKNNWGIELNVETDRLQNTTIYCPDIEKEMYVWDFMTQICQASMCMIFDDEYGIPCIRDTLPNNSNIVITPNRIISVEKNATSSIPNATISVTKRTKHIKEINDSDAKTIYLYDSNGDPVAYDQGLLSFREWEDAPGYHSASVRYGIKFQNPTFSIDGIISRGTKEIVGVRTDEDVAVSLAGYDIDFSLFGNYATVSLTISPSKFADAVNDASAIWTYYRDIRTYLRTTYYTDEESNESYSTTAKQNKQISSNKFIQGNSTYGDKYLPNVILDSIKSRYSKPIKCLQMECLLGDYRDNYGSVILSKGQLFRKYDTVIPYVIRNGKEQPYSIDEKGNPSAFEIVGVEYSYNGFLRQRLHLQENKTVIEPSYLSYSSNEKTKETIFVWAFEGLEAYKKYNISWSLDKRILDILKMFNRDEYFCYFLYKNGTITYKPISKESKDCLVFNTNVEADMNGEIYFGFLMADGIVTPDYGKTYIERIKDYTNYIYLS